MPGNFLAYLSYLFQKRGWQVKWNKQNYDYFLTKRAWQVNWDKENFAPSWQLIEGGIPAEIQEAVDSGWLKPDGRFLDVGCGSGEVTAYFAGRGFNALGLDYADAAIAKAQKKYQSAFPDLSFKTADLCHDTNPGPPEFTALLDRGCFHVIPKAFHRRYVKTVASYAAPEAHFLLLCKLVSPKNLPVSDDELRKNQADMTDHLQDIFAGQFRIVEIRPTVIERKAPDSPMSAFAVYLSRLGEQ